MVISYEKYKKIHEELALCRAELSSAKEELSESKLLLTEAESTLEAIRKGSVDALVVGDQVYTLKGVDYFYRVLLETMGAGAVVFIAEGTITYCNKSIADLLGTSVEKLIGSSIYDYVQDIYTEKFEALVQKGYSGTARGEVSMSFPLHSRDIPVYLSISQIQVDSSAAICMIVTDLTEHKSSKEHIASERLTRAVLEQAGESIVVCNNTGEIVRANASVYQLCGCNILYQYFDHVFHIKVTSTEENEEFSIAQILAGKTIRGVEAVLERTDGQIRYLLLHASKLKGENSEALGCVVTMTDITERKNAEEALKVRNAELNATIFSIAEGIIIYNMEGKIINLNKKAEEILGYSEETREKPMFDRITKYLKVEKEDGQLYPYDEIPVIRALQKREIVTGAEVCLRYSETERLIIDFSAAPIFTKEGIQIGAVATLADITDRKKAEKDLRRSEARFKQLTQTLEQRVNERTAQINVTNEELETLAYSMSHDLYNPIRGISVNNGFAMEKCKERHCSLDELRYIERSRDNITKMEYMLDTMQYLLALLRKTMGRDNINLSLAAKRIMERLKKEDNIRKGDVVIQPDVFTCADKEYVTEVLNGLLSNAWKYTGDKDKYYIEFGKKQIDGTDVYYVKDNGIGFKQEYADKIFQPYYRLQGHSSVREGYGIGLTIVLAIVKKHQGTVWAESEEGKGATFYFTFGGQESAVDMSRKAA